MYCRFKVFSKVEFFCHLNFIKPRIKLQYSNQQKQPDLTGLHLNYLNYRFYISKCTGVLFTADQILSFYAGINNLQGSG